MMMKLMKSRLIGPSLRLTLLLLLSLLYPSSRAAGPAPTTKIKVDQVGYELGAPKLAMVVSTPAADDFMLKRAADGSVVFRGKLSPPVFDADSGDRAQTADFTSLNESGKYYLEVPGVGRSWNFKIAAGAYARTFYLAMRAFYGQRCGTAVDLGPEFPGYTHAACHLRGAYHPSSGGVGPHASAEGWHDAGDYGRYVVNSGLSTGTLLWTWELYGPRLKNIRLDLPESGNGLPDILNEIRWNLDWMLSMQGEDGGVWHKQTGEMFSDFVMPERDPVMSYVIGTGDKPYKSTGATGDFAAVMAVAARLYRPYDRAYAERCLRAARAAWTWTEKYPNVLFHNPPAVKTGEYGDRDCGDELLWASAELWRTTRDEAYQRYFLDHYGRYRSFIRSVGPQSWAQVAPMALWSYALAGGGKPDAVSAIRRDSLSAADEIAERGNQHAYRISMTTKDYVWGSNGVAANYALQLLVTNALEANPRYVRAAMDNLHYLLGRNALSLCFVTQVGEHPFRHPHHRPSVADSNPEPWPGLLSGGPNRLRLDPAMKKLPDLPPARMYLDEWESYATNEVAINWNAPLVFLLAAALPEKPEK